MNRQTLHGLANICAGGWMDEWMNEGMNEWLNGWLDGWMGGSKLY